MELKLLVTSRKLSEKLRKAGVPQKSLFYWTKLNEKWTVIDRKIYNPTTTKEWGKHYSAFLAGELGEMLPLYLKEDTSKGISFSVETKGLQIYKSYSNTRWVVCYGHRSWNGKSLSEAMGKTLLDLIENGHVKAEELGEEGEDG